MTIAQRITVRLGPDTHRVRVPGLHAIAPGALLAAVIALSDPAANLTVGKALAADVSASSIGQGALTASKPLSVSVVAQSVAAASLSIGKTFDSAAFATSSATGVLTIRQDLFGAGPSTSLVAADLIVGKSLQGDVTAASTAAAALTLSQNLAANVNAPAVTTAVLTVARNMDATALAQSSTSATLNVSRALAGAATATSLAAAALTITKGLASDVFAQSTTSAVLTSAAAEDTDAAAYLNAQTTAPSSTERSLVNALVKGLKSDGDWASLDNISIFAAETVQAARLNLKNPAKAWSAINLPTFTANRGYTGDGASAYLDLGDLWNATGNQFSLNSATIGVWCNLQGGTGVKSPFGNLANNPRDTVQARDTAGNETIQINQTAADTLQASPGTRTGHRSISRTGANAVSGFFNGAKVLTSTTVSTNINTTNVSVLRSGTGYTDDRIALLYWGAGLSDAALARIHNRFSAYLTAKGAA
jgi:hypothetical protein